jgi:Ca2+-binding EF-hand superfamily protein
MSKQSSEHLYNLIKSLNRSEKRYFRLLSQQQNESKSKYMQLFDYIDQKENISDLDKIPFIKPSQVSNMKAHLTQKILQALRQYESGKNSEIHIREMIDYVQLLYNRGLLKQAFDILKKAYKKVAKTGNLELKLELLKWEKSLLNQSVGSQYSQSVQRVISEVEDANSKINLINQFTNLAVKLNAIYVKTGYIRNDKHFQEVQELFDKGLPDHEEAELSIHEKLSLYRLYVNYYYFIEDMDLGYHYALKWLHLYDQHLDLKNSQMNDYLSAINQVMIAEYKLFRYQNFLKSRQRLHELNEKMQNSVNENIRNRLIKYVYVHEFNRIFMLGKFNLGVKLLKKLTPDLDAFIQRSDEHSRVILFYKIACLYFGDSQFHKALEWLNRVQQDEKTDLREDIHSFVKILSLIAHYELGNMEVIDYYIRSTYRFLLKKGELHLFQKYILKFLRKLAGEFREEELIPEFKKLLKNLEPLQKIRYEKRSFIYFDIIAWLESKIMGVSVQERIQERAKEKMK